jgi:hypothetical protein
MICDAEHPDAAGVVERITKGWDSSRGKSPRDAVHRHRRAERIFKSIRWEAAHPTGPQVPFELPDGTVRHFSPAREFDPKALDALAEKFIRGLHYAEDKGDIPLSNIVKAHLVPTGGLNMVPQGPRAAYPEAIVRLVNSLPTNDRLRPGFLYRWANVKKDASVWCFRLWGHLTILAACDPARVILAR